MNRIVLIGNGFDLAHDLKTSYADFINWYWEQRLNGMLTKNSPVSQDGLCKLEIKNTRAYANWFNYFHFNSLRDLRTGKWKYSPLDIISAFKDNTNDFSVTYYPLFERICKSIETKKWVDIENDYYLLLDKRVMPIANYTEKDVAFLNLQLELLQIKLIEYLKKEQEKEVNIIEEVKEKIYRSIDEKEISVSFHAVNKENIIENKEPDAILLLNFNYTNILEQYVANTSNTIITYIHGKLDDPQSVIFGYGDELDDDFKKLQNLNENECLRHIKSIHYLESDNYRKVLSFIESEPYQILIMGHSCGNSDRTLLNTLFEHKNCVSIKPYYYKKDDGTDNYLELVQNISRNFTDMKLMRDRVVNKTYTETLTNQKG